MSGSTNANNLHISNHPLILDKLTRMREQSTPHFVFKSLLDEVSIFLFYEATAGFESESTEITTPLEKMNAPRIRKEILLVPILRAGLGMVNGILRTWEGARVGMIGMYRDHDTLKPVDYYLKLPPNIDEMAVFLLDPMLATGGSALSAIDKLKESGARDLAMISLICSPEGVEFVHRRHPDLKIYAAAQDRQLNGIGYILPGLGDAGDRYFGT